MSAPPQAALKSHIEPNSATTLRNKPIFRTLMHYRQTPFE
jgi:hypothetical protein